MLTAIYDLASSPPTYDFAGFLVSAEARRLELGEDRLRLILVAGPHHGFRCDDLPPEDPAARELMLRRIVMPMARLLPSCDEVVRCSVDQVEALIDGTRFPHHWAPDFRVAVYGTRQIVGAWQRGLYPLEAPFQISGYRGWITVTLREAAYHPQRNSNLEAWIAAGRELMRQGHGVVFVRDTARADEPIDGIPTCPRASVDLHYRAALHEAAAVNLFVGNGPLAVCSLQRRARFIAFKTVVEDGICTTARDWDAFGFPVGSQPARPGCRFAWSGDEAPRILEAVYSQLQEPVDA